MLTALALTDIATAHSLMPFLSREASGRSHVFAVLGDTRHLVSSSQTVGRPTGPTGFPAPRSMTGIWPEGSASLAPDGRHDRLIRGFGKEPYRGSAASRRCGRLRRRRVPRHPAVRLPRGWLTLVVDGDLIEDQPESADRRGSPSPSHTLRPDPAAGSRGHRPAEGGRDGDGRLDR